MAEISDDVKLPYWACTDLFPQKEVRNVGDLSSLVCSGMDPVEPGGEYSLDLGEKNKFALKILKTTEDTSLKKTFEIAPYLVAKGDLKLVVLKDGEPAFETVYKKFATTSVLSGEKKPIPPTGPGYMLPTYMTLGAFAVLTLACLGLALYKSIVGLKRQSQYKALISKARYADPFMDFNIELRELDKERKFSAIFLDRLEETFKKCFFRIFEDSVFFDNRESLFRALKGLGAEPHEVRSFYVLEEEYGKFTRMYQETRGQVSDQKKDFISLAKKTVNKLKKYKQDFD